MNEDIYTQRKEDFLELVREFGTQFDYCESTVSLEDVRRALEKLIEEAP